VKISISGIRTRCISSSAPATSSSQKNLDENTPLDVEVKGNVCAITFEHASQRTDISHLVVEGIAA